MVLTTQERLQVAAFHSIYRSLRRAEPEFRRSREEDFAEALLATSDEAMTQTDPTLVEQWIREYGSLRNRDTVDITDCD